MTNIQAIDFFCGAGGLTHGLQMAGINVIAGIDLEISCKATYEYNNNAKFINKSIVDISGAFINKLFRASCLQKSYTMIVGCAPCQPYSSINTRKKENDERKTLLDEFRRVVNTVKPHFVIMENVSRLNAENLYFARFLNMLDKNNYTYEYQILNAKDFNVAQSRKRLFLIASRIKAITPTFEKIQICEYVTVKDVIGELPAIHHGQHYAQDDLHRAKPLNDINLTRIQKTPHNGGRRSAWPESLQVPSHRGKRVFLDNYGRLAWDKLSSTITTKFNQYYSGCFGHPEQNRALSLREGALIQTFPKQYQFFGDDKQIATQIGNAVPVNLAKSVGDLFMMSDLLFENSTI